MLYSAAYSPTIKDDRVLQSLSHNLRALIKGVRRGTLLAMLRRYINFWRADRVITRRYGFTLQGGAFAGMNYAMFPPGHHVAAKVLGTYERELGDFLRDVLARPYEVIVNIGSAEGYYTVGLARHYPDAQAYAFDIQPREQAFCAKLAEINGVAARVDVRGLCDTATLEVILGAHSLIVIDCEGCEFDLLDPDAVPKLRTTDIIAEIHDFGGATRIGDAVRARFAATHDIAIAESQPRDPNDVPLLAPIHDETIRRAAVLERDTFQRWYYLRAKMRA